MAKKKQTHIPVVKDDGTRWMVCDSTGRPVYLVKDGVTKSEAQRLSDGLAIETEIKEITTS